MTFNFDAVPNTAFEIPSQIMKHLDHMPSFNCVMYDANSKTDDRVQVQRVTVNNENVLKFRFKSEVGGPFGKVANPWLSKLPFVPAAEVYSDYNVFLTASGKLYLKSTVENIEATYILGGSDTIQRMADIIAGALKCYSGINNQSQIGMLADDIYRNRASIMSTSGSHLPNTDAVESQIEFSVMRFMAELTSNGFGDAFSANF